MRFGSLAAALVLAVAAAPALAQNVPDKPAQAPAADQAQDPMQRFQAFVTSEEYKGAVAKMAVGYDTISAPECKEHKPQERASLTVYGAPAFDTSPYPISGLWLDRIKMNRCGTTTFQNILIQARADQPPRMAAMLPGTTMTNPPMQGVVMNDIVEALKKKNCKDLTEIVPVDTKHDKESTPIKLDEKGMITAGAWKETWTLRACGKTVNATIDISADGKGGLSHKVKL